MESSSRIRNAMSRIARAGRLALTRSVTAETSKISRVLTVLAPDSRETLNARIRLLEKKIQRVSTAIGKECSRHPTLEAALSSKPVRSSLATVKELTKELERTRLRLVRRATRKIETGWRQRPFASGSRRLGRGEKKLIRITSRLFNVIKAKVSEHLPPEKGGFEQAVRSGKRIIRALARLWRSRVGPPTGLNRVHT